MRRFGVLAAALALAATGFTTTAAHAESAVACEPAGPPGLAAVNGTGAWDPPVTASTEYHTWSMALSAGCYQGTGPDVGDYSFQLAGTSDEDCAHGHGEATLTGSGPEGPLYGGMTFDKYGVHYYLSGWFVSNGYYHQLTLWLDLLALGDQTICPYSNAVVFGHGAIVGYHDTTVTVPQEVVDLINAVVDNVNGIAGPIFAALRDVEVAYVDPTLCAVLSHFPGVYGPVYINSQGDVFVNDEPVWDCPPYDLF